MSKNVFCVMRVEWTKKIAANNDSTCSQLVLLILFFVHIGDGTQKNVKLYLVNNWIVCKAVLFLFTCM